MGDDYLQERKAEFELKIPAYGSEEFAKMRDQIRNALREKESERALLIRRFKTLLLGDWSPESKKQRLNTIKRKIFEAGFFAETTDAYYDFKSGALSQNDLLTHCCVSHQLVILIDGENPGTVAEQGFLAENYVYHGKTVYLIDENKFLEHKGPNAYFRAFPTIITYKEGELLDKVVTFAELRMHRLADIIQTQVKTRKGLQNPGYVHWKERLGKH